LAQAWYTANFHRAKKMPELSWVLRQVRPAQKQSPKAQRLAMEQLSARLGIPLKRTRLIRRDTPSGQ